MNGVSIVYRYGKEIVEIVGVVLYNIYWARAIYVDVVVGDNFVCGFVVDVFCRICFFWWGINIVGYKIVIFVWVDICVDCWVIFIWG